ncbi:aldehyde dehydrogenase family protein [Paenochrobactrum sp. BZR 201-1]
MPKMTSISQILSAQKAAFSQETNPPAVVRKDRLIRLVKTVLKNEAAFVAALQTDYGHRAPFATKAGDILGTINAIEYHLQHLENWMKPKPVFLNEEAEKHGIFAEVHYQPIGVLGALIPWNGPVLMACLAAMGGIAAGNRVMLKMSELAPETGFVFEQAIASEFDQSEVAVINGDASVAAEFSRQAFNHLLFTGSTSTGQKVMKAAAENLVPVTLELGGKSPVIISRDADLRVVADRLTLGKLASAGQVCVSPDYVLVSKGQTEKLIAEIISATNKFFPNILENNDYTSLINASANNRMKKLLEDATEKGARFVFAPEDYSTKTVPLGGRFPFVIVTNVSMNMLLMQEEIFGPLLPIMEYDSVENALSIIEKNPNPLSAYYFGSDENEAKKYANHILTGSMVINDVRIQLAYEALPFGGIGSSGIGRYRGHAGFITFSNQKTIIHQGATEEVLARQRPPYSAQHHDYIQSAIMNKKEQYGISQT